MKVAILVFIATSDLFMSEVQREDNSKIHVCADIRLNLELFYFSSQQLLTVKIKILLLDIDIYFCYYFYFIGCENAKISSR